MKTISKIILVAAGLVFILNSCTQNNFNVPEIVINELDERPEATITIEELRERFIITEGFFSADKMESSENLIFNGIVTSTDVEGNIYKYIVVQEEGINKRAIRISIDANGIFLIYQLGQRVSVLANNLHIGKYGESPQIGSFTINSTGRVTPGTIPLALAERVHVRQFGRPDPSAVVADTMTIAEILNTPKEEMHYKLVCIKNAFFTGRGAESNQPTLNILPESERIFAPGTGGLNYPQSREIQDGTGSIFVSTSEYARFAQKPLPASSYVGNITAIVTWYNNRDTPPIAGRIYYQLTLRTLSDLGTGFEGYLEK